MRETNFKQTEIGPIPVDWELKPLGESYSIRSSKRVFQSQWTTQGVPFFRAREIVSLNNHENFSSPLYITCSLYEFLKNSYGVPQINDILVTGVGTLGIPYLVTDNIPFYFKDGNIIWLQYQGVSDSKYIYYCFKSPILLDQIYGEGIGSTVGTYTIRRARKTIVPFPPIEEQIKIGGTLTDIDELIFNSQNLLAKKRSIKSGAMSNLLSGRVRLPGFTDSWVSSTLDELGFILPNNTLARDMLTERGSIMNIHYGDVLIKYGAVLDIHKTDVPFVHEILNERFLKSAHAKEGDVIFADTAEDETVGKATELVNIGDNIVVSGLHTYWYRPNIEFSKGFLGYAFNSKEFHCQVVPVISGTKVCSISKPSLLSFTLFYPSSIEEQRAIVKILTDMDDDIAALEAKLKKYEQLKQGMMQQLLTGKIRLVSPNESQS